MVSIYANLLEQKKKRIGLEHQHGRYFIVLERQYGRHKVMWKLMLYTIYFDLEEPNSGTPWMIILSP